VNDTAGERILNFVNRVGKTTSQIQQIHKENEAGERRAGYASAARKETPEESASRAFLEGHEKFRGNADANKYRLDVEALLNRSDDMDPKKFLAEKEKISHKYLNGAPDSYVHGFIPSALQVEGSVEKRYADRQFDILQKGYLSDVSEGAELALDMVLKADSITDKAGALREKLTGMQEMGKYYGLDRTEVAGQVISTLGNLAVKSGRPDILNFAYVRDKDGHRLIDRPEVKAKLEQYQRQAIAKQESMVTEKLSLEDSRQEQAVNDFDKSIIKALDDDNFDLADAKLESVKPHLTPARYEQLLKRANQARSGAGYADSTNMESYRLAYDKATDGLLTEEEWANIPAFVTKSDYKELLKVNSRGGGGADKKYSMTEVNEYKRMAVKSVAQQNTLTSVFSEGNLGEDRANWARHAFNIAVSEHIDKENETPNIKLMMEWVVSIGKAAYLNFPEDGSKPDTTTNGHPADGGIVRGTIPVQPKKDNRKFTESAGNPIVNGVDDLQSRKQSTLDMIEGTDSN
jgi:hypothetical protein